MYQLVNWNPFHDLDQIRRQMTAANEVWQPVVDIVEDEHAYIFKVELPNVQKDDVSVQIENGSLHISGERKAESHQRIRRVHRIERAHGAFARSFDLPDDIDASKVEAVFKDGLLAVVIGKAEQAKPRKIAVRVE